MDSPRCFSCIEHGLTGQTHKVCGQPYYKCQSCKRLTHVGYYQPIELQWKENPKDWMEFAKTKVDSKNKVGMNKLKEM